MENVENNVERSGISIGIIISKRLMISKPILRLNKSIINPIILPEPRWLKHIDEWLKQRKDNR